MEGASVSGLSEKEKHDLFLCVASVHQSLFRLQSMFLKKKPAKGPPPHRHGQEGVQTPPPPLPSSVSSSSDDALLTNLSGGVGKALASLTEALLAAREQVTVIPTETRTEETTTETTQTQTQPAFFGGGERSPAAPRTPNTPGGITKMTVSHYISFLEHSQASGITKQIKGLQSIRKYLKNRLKLARIAVYNAEVAIEGSTEAETYGEAHAKVASLEADMTKVQRQIAKLKSDLERVTPTKSTPLRSAVNASSLPTDPSFPSFSIPSSKKKIHTRDPVLASPPVFHLTSGATTRSLQEERDNRQVRRTLDKLFASTTRGTVSPLAPRSHHVANNVTNAPFPPLGSPTFKPMSAPPNHHGLDRSIGLSIPSPTKKLIL